MPLLVVALASDQTELLTLGEYEALLGCERVLFEDVGHPLAAKLRHAGAAVSALEDDPDATTEGWGLVCDPGSARLMDLAAAGAAVTAGPGRAPDALTAAHGAPVVRAAAAAMADLALVMARLRSADGCPWDVQQTHESLQVHLLEEAHEVIDAIDRGAVTGELEEELGDVLLQVAFHARLAEQDGRFDIATVARRIVAKLIHRHPHVFGDVEVRDAGEVVANWEAIKAKEKRGGLGRTAGQRGGLGRTAEQMGRAGVFDGIPSSLGALPTAYKVIKRAAGLGFEGKAGTAGSRIEELLAGDPGSPEAIGEALFCLVVMARAAGVEPEGALRRATARFGDSL